MRKIGVIGGMGPEATALLFQRVIQRTPAADDRDHIPLLIDNDPRIPSRIRFLIEENGEDPSAYLCRIAQNLESAGCAALAMPCNTAHYFADAIRESVSVPFLDMVQLSAQHLKDQGYGKVGMLCSPALRKVGVFNAAFDQQGLEAIFPANDQQPLALIREIKAGRVPDTEALSALIRELQRCEADIVLISCSEFSLYRDYLDTTLALVDTLDVLTEAVVSFARNS